MSQNPLNLVLRFLLELGALFAVGCWGWTRFEGILRIIIAIGSPLLFAVIWGTFRVPGDASANGKAPIAVPGRLRLLIELAFFTFGTWCLLDTDRAAAAYLFGGIALFHYLISYDRIIWLLRK